MSTKTIEQLQKESENSANYYAEHLAEVNNTNSVITTEEIINKDKIPLVKKGMRINNDVIQRILKHKLSKPLENTVDIENKIEKDSLLNHFNLVLEKYPDIKQLHQSIGYESAFKTQILSYILPSLITQKLTVFSQQFPKEFEQTLLCTLLAVNIAHTIKLSKDQLITTYIAGLSHDLGLLHIPPETVNDKENFTSVRWRSIKTHVITGYLFINDLGPNYKDTAKAVLEHHERCDGTGYPLAKKAEEIGIVGQIIGMADSLQSIRMLQFEQVGRNLRYALPFIRMNFTTFSETIYRATTTVVSTVSEDSDPIYSFNNYTELAQHLIKRGEKLNSANTIVRLLYQLSIELNLSKDGLEMINQMVPFDKMIRQSGLIEEHVDRWLAHVIDTEDYNPLKELCELELMQNELYWQLKKVRNSYSYFLEQEPNAGPENMMRHLLKVAASINDYLKT